MPAVSRAIMPGPISETTNGFMTPFTVFKFDGGPSLKFTCHVDLCEGGCNPVSFYGVQALFISQNLLGTFKNLRPSQGLSQEGGGGTLC